jgi:hypothetical protein
MGDRSTATSFHVICSTTSERANEGLLRDDIYIYMDPGSWDRNAFMTRKRVSRSRCVISARRLSACYLFSPSTCMAHDGPMLTSLQQPQSSTFQGFWSTVQRADTSKRHVITKFQIV